jgi:hypothetical protein
MAVRLGGSPSTPKEIEPPVALMISGSDAFTIVDYILSIGQGCQKTKPIDSRRLPGFQKKSPTVLQTIWSNPWVHVDSTDSFFPDREKGLEIVPEGNPLKNWNVGIMGSKVGKK